MQYILPHLLTNPTQLNQRILKALKSSKPGSLFSLIGIVIIDLVFVQDFIVKNSATHIKRQKTAWNRHLNYSATHFIGKRHLATHLNSKPNNPSKPA